ncbi:hypothetical protein JCM16418_1411 [Paenibacillus pini JCM 16418]|uniref:Uncharacterized protein n=1 Tax=Paenibacillus pini JCM 16418 TaxID=1236976 RepID=W7Y8W5_9BACL|nr:hypothetical protein JCM16418_1411 [Paenibacillus pini JCM 16418]
MDSTSAMGIFSILPMIMIIFYLGATALGIYCLILFIKLAHRGIKALDIYIHEKTNRRI